MKNELTAAEKDALLPGPRLAVGPNEKLETAQTRLEGLEHEVAEAQRAVDSHPESESARAKLAMMISIRDVGKTDVIGAEQKLRDANKSAPDAKQSSADCATGS